jgi:flagellin-like hook-associated protein FlgL
MSGISLSVGIRNSLFSLQDSARMAETVQTRLATGKRVNSALDNPTNFFTAANLTSRANDLNNLLDSMSNAVKTIEAADNGIKSITKLVESAQSVVRQAKEANSGTAAAATGTANVTAATVAGGAGSLVLRTGSGPNITFTTGAATTVGELVTSINSANVGVKAELVQNGANQNVRLTSTNGQALTIDASSTAAVLTATGLTAGTTTPGASGDAARLTSLASQFNDLRTQIQRAASDAGFNGINLLNNQSLTVQFNETNTSNISITAVDYGSASNPLGVASVASGVFNTTTIADAESQLSSALTRLRSDSSRLGSNLSTVQTRQDFTRSMMKTLQTGADNLVLADQNEEAANLLTLQTRQQLSQQTLSLASQQQQGVLRLLG